LLREFRQRRDSVKKKTTVTRWISRLGKHPDIRVGLLEAEALSRELEGNAPSARLIQELSTYLESAATNRHSGIELPRLISDYEVNQAHYARCLMEHLGQPSSSTPPRSANGAVASQKYEHVQPASPPSHAHGPITVEQVSVQTASLALTTKCIPCTASALPRNGMSGTPQPMANPQSNFLWIAPGDEVVVQDFLIQGGMLYVGTHLASVNKNEIEPALIIPDRPVQRSEANCHAPCIGSWPSYDKATPEARASYLQWLSAGKCDPDADLGYVFLYYFGLERRALCDGGHNSQAKAEIPLLMREVQRLLSIYGGNARFFGYAVSFLDFLAAGRAEMPQLENLSAPPRIPKRGISYEMRTGIGLHARDQCALPSEWALAWYLAAQSPYGPAVAHCPKHFALLFRKEYEARFGNGIELPANTKRLAIDYWPVSHSFLGASVTAQLDIPDVFSFGNPLQGIQRVAVTCCLSLKTSGLFLGNNSDESILESLKMLMHDIANSGGVRVMTLRELQSTLPSETELNGSRLQEFGRLLGGMGLGVEPDARFDGFIPGPDDTVALFTAEGLDDQDRPLSANFARAISMLELSSAVIRREFDDIEATMLLDHVQTELDLSSAERGRLTARLRLHRTLPPAPGLKTRVAFLETAARNRLVALLQEIAVGNNTVNFTDVDVLENGFRTLAIDHSPIRANINQPTVDAVSSSSGAIVSIPESFSASPLDPPASMQAGIMSKDHQEMIRRIIEVIKRLQASKVAEPVRQTGALGPLPLRTEDRKLSYNFARAVLMLDLACAVGLEDRGYDETEVLMVLDHIQAELDVPDSERCRLRQQVYRTSKGSLTSLKKQIYGLDKSDRDRLGEFLLTISLTNGVLEPGRVKNLENLFRSVGLDEVLLLDSKVKHPAVEPVSLLQTLAKSDDASICPAPPTPVNAAIAVLSTANTPFGTGSKEHQEMIRRIIEIIKKARAYRVAEGLETLSPAHVAHSNLVWIPPSEDVSIQGFLIQGGMIYVGTHLTSVNKDEVEPALVNPTKPVQSSRANCHTRYWGGSPVSYDRACPEDRASYLQWLSTGKCDPTADIFYVYLYFFGLERRVLHDTVGDSQAKAEIPLIEREVQRLARIYGSKVRFLAHANSLLDFLAAGRVAMPKLDNLAAPPWIHLRGLSYEMRMAIGLHLRNQCPLPAAWALAWYLAKNPHRNDIQHCPEHFALLFRKEYESRFKDGMKLPVNSTRLTIDYKPASHSFIGANITTELDLPDVSSSGNSLRALELVGEACIASLNTSGVFLGSNPEGTVLESFGRLRRDIANAGQVRLLNWRELRKALPDGTELNGRRLREIGRVLGGLGLGIEPDARFSGGLPGPDDTVALFTAEGLDDQDRPLSANFAKAVSMIQFVLTAANRNFDDAETTVLLDQVQVGLGLSNVERGRLAARLKLSGEAGFKVSFKLTVVARGILIARLRLKISTTKGIVDPKVADGLDKAFRSLGLDLVLLHAQTDPSATKPKSAIVQSALQGRAAHILEPSSTPNFAQAPVPVQKSPAQPVSVLPNSGLSATFQIPAPMSAVHKLNDGIQLDPARVAALKLDSEKASELLTAIFDQQRTVAQEPSPTESCHTTPKVANRIEIDLTEVAALKSDTAQVSALLGSIFVEQYPVANDQPHSAPAVPPLKASDAVLDRKEVAALKTDSAKISALLGSIFDEGSDVGPTESLADAGSSSILNLDTEHKSLLRLLRQRSQWSRVQIEELCADRGLMVDGAIERINDAAFEQFDEALIEGDDPVVINCELLSEEME
jgi:hypothetical protein